MNIKDLTGLIQNGSVHIYIIDDNTGEILFADIWHNKIARNLLEKQIVCIEVDRYTLRLHV